MVMLTCTFFQHRGVRGAALYNVHYADYYGSKEVFTLHHTTDSPCYYHFNDPLSHFDKSQKTSVLISNLIHDM